MLASRIPVFVIFPYVKASTINYLVDAGPLVALLNKGDINGSWAKGAFAVIDEPVATTEAAFAEAAHLLKKYRPALIALTEAVEEGQIVIMPVLAQNAAAIAEKLRKYSQMDLADATLVALSEQYPRAKLITIDRTDFTIYRRRDGKPVPTIMPNA